MQAMIEKIKLAYSRSRERSVIQPAFRIIEIHADHFGTPIFSIQLIGKNICFKYSRQELLNNNYIYENISEYERIIIKEYGKTLQNTNLSKNNLKVIEFQKNYITSFSTDEITKQTIFKICIDTNDQKKIYSLSAKEIMSNSKMFDALNQNDKIQISYYAGMEDILNENNYFKKKKFDLISSLKSLLIKYKKTDGAQPHN